MSKIKWDQISEKIYETGVKHGVIFPQNSDGSYAAGVAWNGLSNVTESPSGGEPNDVYADDIKYASIYSTENFGASIEAYTYPDEFAVCDGSAEPVKGVRIGQQPRKPFGFSYVTTIGNDTEGTDYGYKIHLVYNAMAAPSEKEHATMGESIDAGTFSWEVTTTPVEISTINPTTNKPYKPTAHIEINSTDFTATADLTKLQNLENRLYGTDDVYTKFTGSTFVEGTTYYEKNGATYTETGDESPVEGKTYYTKTSTGTASSFPTPEEVFEILGSSN